MAWELSSWLVLTRAFQLMASLAAGSLNGFLVAWIYINKLGLLRNMIALELMICILLIYLTLALIIQHTGGRSKRSEWLTFFIVCDMLFIGMNMGVITVLARAGIPSSCVGLTSSDSGPNDPADTPAYGYTTTRFSDEAGGHKGELDRYCAFEQSFYFIAIGLVFTFLVTIVLSVLRICESSYTKNTRVAELLESLERANEKEQQSPLLPARPRFTSPPSEGLITRQTSMRSVNTTSQASVAAPYGALPVIPRRPVPNRTSAPPVIPSPIDEGSEMRSDSPDEEYSALVADGMTHQSPQSQHYAHTQARPLQQQQHQQPTRHQNMPLLPEENDASSLSEAGIVADGMRYMPNDAHMHHQQQQQHHQAYSPAALAAAAAAIPPLDEESAALVSDGSRPLPRLPPYTARRGSSSSSTAVPGLPPTRGAEEDDDGMASKDYPPPLPPRVRDMKPSGHFLQ